MWKNWSVERKLTFSYQFFYNLSWTIDVSLHWQFCLMMNMHQLSNSDYKKIGKRKSIFVKLINFFTLFVFLSFSLSFILSFFLLFYFVLFTYELSYYLLFLMPSSSPHFYTSAICRLRKWRCRVSSSNCSFSWSISWFCHLP